MEKESNAHRTYCTRLDGCECVTSNEFSAWNRRTIKIRTEREPTNGEKKYILKQSKLFNKTKTDCSVCRSWGRGFDSPFSNSHWSPSNFNIFIQNVFVPFHLSHSGDAVAYVLHAAPNTLCIDGYCRQRHRCMLHARNSINPRVDIRAATQQRIRV